MQLFDELSLYIRGIHAGAEHLEVLLKGVLCHLDSASWARMWKETLSLLGRNKDTSFPTIIFEY